MAEARGQWTGYIELRGLYAAVHRGQRGGIGPDTPLVVLRDGAAADGCPRAYRLGLRPGMPRREVLHHVPGAALVDFGEAEYGPAGRALWSACARYSPLVEPAGPDRAFVGLTAPAGVPPREEVVSLLHHAVRAVARAAGVPPAEIEGMAGLARSKLVARAALHAAGERRPVVAVPAGQEAEFLSPLPVEVLWKAPPEAMDRLHALGVKRVGEIAEFGEAALWPHFGPLARDLVRWARGEDGEPVRALWPERAHTWRRAFPEGVGSEALVPALGLAADALSARLQAAGEACRAVRLRLEPAEGVARAGERRLARPQARAESLRQTLLALFRELTAPDAGTPSRTWIALQAQVADLAPAGHRQLDLWGQAGRDEEARRRLAEAVAAGGERFPVRVLRRGMPVTGIELRREHMLHLYDPMRWTPGERATWERAAR
ncbi:DNA polymerase Y family protein [Caldinitratiruptor microaerophilus]|uniref:UmuC domain-containing protein n=1 Tax=Caldinitratiruptor microaerophilus TaxID=671077 RepID=A0AA35G8G7_9FIRM|nr:hypothetical protein [Caldinitratiruptor microaerophilus]BDG60423.1 hypothetical protein caldi_15130 [Caldinitratiruptor microaerophilus]